ncbi:MAG: BMC domain-containing protein [Lachnospiraceae bacterium]|nr:BMC domain-containing protein [Lachnospiraceae bacterium]
MEFDEKQRIIQEFVPGKQITLAHVIAKPNPDFYNKFGLLDEKGSVGIMTITPSEGAMIASDVCTKAAKVHVGFVDRFNGSLVITGDVSAVEAALRDVMAVMCDRAGLGFAPTIITKT